MRNKQQLTALIPYVMVMLAISPSSSSMPDPPQKS
jgi:hypothetical protein